MRGFGAPTERYDAAIAALTEVSPFISICEPRPEHASLDLRARGQIKARQGVAALIGSGAQPLLDASLWADDHRTEETDGWHYVDIPLNALTCVAASVPTCVSVRLPTAVVLNPATWFVVAFVRSIASSKSLDNELSCAVVRLRSWTVLNAPICVIEVFAQTSRFNIFYEGDSFSQN